MLINVKKNVFHRTNTRTTQNYSSKTSQKTDHQNKLIFELT